MNYEQRTAIIFAELRRYLAPLAAPKALDEDGQVEMLSRMVAAINSRLALGNEDMVRGSLERMFDAVTRSHKGWAWPAPEEFVSAVPSGGGGGKAPETYKRRDDAEAIAAKMQAGEAVPEGAVWRNPYGVPPEVLSKYRQASVDAAKGVYGLAGARSYLVSKYGDVPRSYFPQEAAE